MIPNHFELESTCISTSWSERSCFFKNWKHVHLTILLTQLPLPDPFLMLSKLPFLMLSELHRSCTAVKVSTKYLHETQYFRLGKISWLCKWDSGCRIHLQIARSKDDIFAVRHKILILLLFYHSFPHSFYSLLQVSSCYDEFYLFNLHRIP